MYPSARCGVQGDSSSPDGGWGKAPELPWIRARAVDDGTLAALLGKGYAAWFDEFDLVQFAHVVAVCRTSSTAADAAKKLFAVSRKAKKSSNDSDRLTKYLSRFGVKFKDIKQAR